MLHDWPAHLIEVNKFGEENYGAPRYVIFANTLLLLLLKYQYFPQYSHRGGLDSTTGPSV